MDRTDRSSSRRLTGRAATWPGRGARLRVVLRGAAVGWLLITLMFAQDAHAAQSARAREGGAAVSTRSVAALERALAGSAEVSAPATRARANQDSPGLSLDAAVDLVQRRYAARVIRADVTNQGGARVYVLRLLSSDGRVWTVRVDAATGSVSE